MPEQNKVERWVNNCKNHSTLSMMIFLGVALIGIANFTEALDKIKIHLPPATHCCEGKWLLEVKYPKIHNVQSKMGDYIGTGGAVMVYDNTKNAYDVTYWNGISENDDLENKLITVVRNGFLKVDEKTLQFNEVEFSKIVRTGKQPFDKLANHQIIFKNYTYSLKDGQINEISGDLDSTDHSTIGRFTLTREQK